jgi:hypothetical protein
MNGSFITNGKTDIAIPLPVILYSKHSGLHIFSSLKYIKNRKISLFTLAKRGLTEKK